MSQPSEPHRVDRHRAHLWAPLVACLASTIAGCTAAPPPRFPEPCKRSDLSGCVINEVAIVGNASVPSSEITEKLATAESAHPFGGVVEHVPVLGLWDRLSVDYERFDPFVLERDLTRVERIYHSLGFYEAHTRAGRVMKSNDGVRVEIVVDEGKRVLVGNIALVWNGASPPAARIKAAEQRARKTMPVKAPLVEKDLEDTRQGIARALTNHGYAYAEVEAHADVNLSAHTAVVTYRVNAGPPCKFGKVSLDGIGDLPEARLRAALDVREGEEYSRATLDSAERALAAFGVFGSVEATPDLTGKGKTTDVPIVFHVTRAPLRVVKLGGGAEVGSRVEAHAVAGWEHKNFFGGLRSFAVEAKPGVEFYPLTVNSLFTPPPTGSRMLPTLRMNASILQPGFFEARTRGRVILAANAYRLFTSGIVDDAVLGYLEFASKGGVERSFSDGQVTVGLYGSAQYENPFSYVEKPLPDGVSTILFGYAQATAALDLRTGKNNKPDPVNPHSGLYVSADTQAAWGDAQDFRLRPEIRGYLPIAKPVTLALRATFGFLFPYGGDMATRGCQTQGTATSCPAQTYDRYLQLLQFRGFMSGGPYSNRGYPATGVGPHQVVPALSPTLPDPGKTQIPIATGGLGMWEGSVELRVDLLKKISAVVFLDGSDVSLEIAQMNLQSPHLSTGLGLRYATPVGPFRADLGVRIPGAQVLGSTCPVYDPDNAPNLKAAVLQGKLAGCGANQNGNLAPVYGVASSIAGLPLAVSLAIGEAF